MPAFSLVHSANIIMTGRVIEDDDGTWFEDPTGDDLPEPYKTIGIVANEHCNVSGNVFTAQDYSKSCFL